MLTKGNAKQYYVTRRRAPVSRCPLNAESQPGRAAGVMVRDAWRCVAKLRSMCVPCPSTLKWRCVTIWRLYAILRDVTRCCAMLRDVLRCFAKGAAFSWRGSVQTTVMIRAIAICLHKVTLLVILPLRPVSDIHDDLYHTSALSGSTTIL